MPLSAGIEDIVMCASDSRRQLWPNKKKTFLYKHRPLCKETKRVPLMGLKNESWRIKHWVMFRECGLRYTGLFKTGTCAAQLIFQAWELQIYTEHNTYLTRQLSQPTDNENDTRLNVISGLCQILDSTHGSRQSITYTVIYNPSDNMNRMWHMLV